MMLDALLVSIAKLHCKGIMHDAYAQTDRQTNRHTGVVKLSGDMSLSYAREETAENE